MIETLSETDKDIIIRCALDSSFFEETISHQETAHLAVMSQDSSVVNAITKNGEGEYV